MNVPTIPMLNRLTKVHKYSAAGVAAAGAGVLAITGVSGTAGTAVAAQQVADWTPASNVQQQSIAGQAGSQAVAAKKKAVADAAAAAKKKAAAAAAAKKKHEAAVAAASKRKAQAAAASRSQVRKAITKSPARAVVSGTPQQIAASMMSASQFQCFSNIVSHESSWNPSATNGSSGAYGLVQALPGSKMASAGADWRTNPATQIKWGLSYMNGRYGSPCGAWSFWQAHSWY
ncbi:transglycosylase SLT domain-containing protein [Streptomyces sp. NPDC059373]